MKTSTTAFLAALLACTLPAARAQMIGVSYGSGNATTTLAATDVAGVPGFTQANWNNATTASATALRNNAGTATTAAVTLSTTAGGLIFTPIRGGNVSGADEVLNNGMVTTEVTTLTVSLSNIPYSSYSLVVYSLNAQTSQPARLTLGSTTLWVRPPANPIGAGYIDNNAATAFTYTQSTSATQAGAPANSDYVVFTGLSGASQTLTLLSNDFGGTSDSAIQAFQIVNTAPVPEPGTYALLAAGAAGLGLVLRQRRRAAL